MDDATAVSVTLDVEDIARIRADLGLDRFTSASFSTLFVIELYLMRYARVVSAPDVLTEIAALEGVGPPSRTKPPTQFKHPPLAPLWHKHFFAANAILHNLKNQWSGGWLEEQIGRHFAQSESGFLDDAMAIRIAATAVDEALSVRTQESKLSGHWLIFAQHEGRRYYLSVTPHSKDRAGDERIFGPIRSVCGPEYPFLRLV